MGSRGIGTRWYFMTIFLARSASRLALKKKPEAMSTCGGGGFQPSRVTVPLSKIAQIGPPPLWPSSMPASAAFSQLFGVFAALHVAPIALYVVLDRVVVVSDVLAPGLVVEATAEHVDADHILPIPHVKTAGPCLV